MNRRRRAGATLGALAVAVGAVSVLLAAKPAVSTAATGTGTWLEFDHDPADTAASDASPITAANIATVRPVWSTTALGQSPSVQTVVANGVAVVSGDHVVEGVDQETGKVIWSTRFATFSTLGPITPVIDTSLGYVYVPYADVTDDTMTPQFNGMSVVAYKLATGQQVWRHDISVTNSFYGAMLTPTGLVIATNQGQMLSINPASGATQWSRGSLQNPVWPMAYGAGDLISFNGATDSEEVDNPATGALKWTLTGAFRNPIIANGLIYVAQPVEHNDGTPNAGEVLAYSPIGCSATACGPVGGAAISITGDDGFAYSNGRVFVEGASSSSTPVVVALNANTGQLLWSGTGPTGGVAGGQLSVAGNLVLAASNQGPNGDPTVYAFNAAGCGQAICGPIAGTSLNTSQVSGAYVVGDRLFLGPYVYGLP